MNQAVNGLQEILSQYGYFILFILSFFGVGAIAFEFFKIKLERPAEYFFYASLAGSVISILFFSISYLSGMYSPFSIYALCFFSIPGIYFFRKIAEIKLLVLITMILGLLFYQVFYSLFPPYQFDATMYHLPIIEKIIGNAPLDFNTNIRYPTYPFFGEVFLSIGMFFGDAQAQLVSCYALFLIAVGIGKEFIYKSYWKAIVAILLLLGIKPLILHSHTAYIDIILALFVFAAFLTMKNIIYDQYKVPMVLAGAFIGIAVGTKYSAGIFAVELGLFLVLVKKWKELAWYAPTGILIGGIWYLRNYLIVGNPVWPFLTHIFNTKGVWSSSDYQYQFSDLLKQSVNFTEFSEKISHSEGGISFFVFLGIWLYLVLQRNSKSSKFYFWILVPYIIFWFFSAQYVRYLMPALPICCLIVAEGYFSFVEKWNDVHFVKVSLWLVALFTYFSAAYIYPGDIKISVLDQAVHNRDDFLALRLPGYNAVNYANKLPGKTYAAYLENLNYYGKCKLYGDHFGVYRYETLRKLFENQDLIGVRNHLKDIDMQFFLLPLKFATLVEGSPNFQPIYRDDKFVIFEVK